MSNEIDDAIAALENFPKELLLAIHGLDEPALAVPERDGAWSVLQVIAHLCDFEQQLLWRSRAIVATDEPRLPPFAQEEWVAATHVGATKAEMLRELLVLRQMNVAFLRRLGRETFQRLGVHAEYGTLTLAELLQRAVGHQQRHLGQIRRIVETLQLAPRQTDVSGAESVVASSRPARPGLEGIRVREIWRDGWRHAQLVEIDAGAVFPSIDYHVPGAEEVFVVSGVFDDGAARYDAGTFIHYPAGSSHVPQSATGCTLFVFYPEG